MEGGSSQSREFMQFFSKHVGSAGRSCFQLRISRTVLQLMACQTHPKTVFLKHSQDINITLYHIISHHITSHLYKEILKVE